MIGAAERSAREHVAAITAALDGGDNEGAADLAGQGLAAFPDAAVFHRLRGVGLFGLGVSAEALAHLTAALDVDPLDNTAILALARLADAQGDPYTAAEHFVTAWEHDPANPALRAELTERLAALYGPEGYLQFTRPALAALYVRNAFPERAAREYRDILAEHPSRIDLRLAAALAQWRLGNLTETVEACTALLDTQPQIVRARWALADAMARRGRGEVARDHAKQAAHVDPDGAIARDLIAANPDAAIVDPDEPMRVPLDRRAQIHVVSTAPSAPPAVEVEATDDTTLGERPVGEGETPPRTNTMRLVETLSGLAAALVAANAAPHAELLAHPESEETRTDALSESDLRLPGTEGLAEALAALDSPTPSLPNPLDVPYVPPTEQEALADVVPETVAEEREPVVAVVEAGGAIIATTVGGEPSLDAADALPTTPIADAQDGGSHRRAPADDMTPTTRTTARAGDVAGAVGRMRAALASAGADPERVRALLPALRALADATPERPDSRRLLGDAYARLGLYAQAQGQYRQALLVRVAGKGAGR